MSGNTQLSPATTAKLLRGAAAAALLILIFALRVVTGSASELAQAEQLEKRGDLEGAVVHYRRAARWYAPASPYHVRALARLEAIGAQAVKDGDVDGALVAYRAVRASIMASRSFYVPEPERLARADRQIATLMARQPIPPMDRGKTPQQLRDEHLALLQADPDPSLLWTLVMLAGFVLWVGSAFTLSLRGIDGDDRWRMTELRRWGSLVLMGLVMFALGLGLA